MLGSLVLSRPSRYHEFYRRHRFAHTKKKGGWDVGCSRDVALFAAVLCEVSDLVEPPPFARPRGMLRSLPWAQPGAHSPAAGRPVWCFLFWQFPMAGCLVFRFSQRYRTSPAWPRHSEPAWLQGLRCTEQAPPLAVPFVPKSLLLKAKRQCGPWTTLGKPVTSENCALVRLLPFSLRLEAVYNAMALPHHTSECPEICSMLRASSII